MNELKTIKTVELDKNLTELTKVNVPNEHARWP